MNVPVAYVTEPSKNKSVLSPKPVHVVIKQ
jgi:hypothetical protein